MSETINKKIEFVNKHFKDFSHFIELESFRAFLLLTLNSQSPTNLMAQLGLGGNREIINLPYDPVRSIYYQKINLLSSSSIIIYVKTKEITDKFLLDKDNDIFKKYLNINESSLAFRGKEKFLFPKVTDCSTIDDSKLNIKIDDYFHSIEAFIGFTQPNILFVVDSENPSEPDLVFTFNMAPKIPRSSEENALKLDVFLDEEHKLKDITYIQREENYSIKYMKDIKEVSHADLYKSAFSLILHIKSFQNPTK
ncbi:MAG: hypothetical protein EU531_09100 [Promethearchaeota archaeon]|nr:MAG: hypothetical protein EU531_09100 [Candidatus Lokiarchaeota archaeon]